MSKSKTVSAPKVKCVTDRIQKAVKDCDFDKTLSIILHMPESDYEEYEYLVSETCDEYLS